MYFTRPPVIHNTGTKRGTYVQGSFDDASDDEKSIFMDVFEGFQDLVSPGQKLTGSQWIAAIIKDLGDVAIRRPNALNFLETVRKVMLLSTFNDDCVLVDPQGNPMWRGSKGDCIDKQYEIADLDSDDLKAWTTIPVKDVDAGVIDDLKLKMASSHAQSIGLCEIRKSRLDKQSDELSFPAHFYDIDQSIKVYATQNNTRDPKQDERVGVRALELLNTRASVVNGDKPALLLLMQMLCNNFGFNSLMYDENGQPTEYILTEASEVIHSPEQMEEKLHRWARLSENLPRTKTVHLCRPACLMNLSAIRESYETLVSRSQLGWRIPNTCWVQFHE